MVTVRLLLRGRALVALAFGMAASRPLMVDRMALTGDCMQSLGAVFQDVPRFGHVQYLACHDACQAERPRDYAAPTVILSGSPPSSVLLPTADSAIRNRHVQKLLPTWVPLQSLAPQLGDHMCHVCTCALADTDVNCGLLL